MPDASTPRVARVWYAKYGRLVVLASWLSRVGLVVVLVCAAGGVLAGCRDDSRSQQSRGEERRSEVSRKSRGKADAMTVFTIAGASSQAASPCRPVRDNDCAPPPGAGRRWPATDRRFTGTCLTHLADGTVLLCHGGRLLALSRAGLMRRWPRHGAGAGVGELLDADAGPDGAVMVVGESGVARVRFNGDSQRMRGLSIDYTATAIAALPDGGALVVTDEGLARLNAAGKIVARPPGFDVSDIAALRNGAFALAQAESGPTKGKPNPGRVLRLGRDNKLTVLAGGGHGFKEGAKGTDVDLGDVSAVARTSKGALLIGAERGLLLLDTSGRIHTLVDAGAQSYVASSDPRAVNDDGQPAREVRLNEISEIDTLNGRHPLVLTTVPGPDETKRLALIAPANRAGRLAVALPPRNRILVQDDRVEILTTRKADGRVDLYNGTQLVASRTIALARGRTHITLRVPPSSEPHVLHVVASTSRGAVTSHQLTVIPTPALTRPMITRIENAISLIGTSVETDATVNCEDPRSRRSSCAIGWFGESDVTSYGVLRLRDDGLITFNGPRVGQQVDALNLAFDPLTYDPRP